MMTYILKNANAEAHVKQNNKPFSEPTRTTNLTSGDISKITFSIYAYCHTISTFDIESTVCIDL
jgi:hypothetical protein